jgi:hypothetical protein
MGNVYELEGENRARVGETAHSRFRRLAQKRVTRTIKELRLIGNLGNRNNYSYSTEEADKIFRALEKELKQARAKFDSRGKGNNEIDFSL